MTDKYTSTSQQRVLKTLKALFGHEVTGISNQDLAKRLGSTSDRVFKDLKNLEQAGLAEQLPNKNWRIASNLGREAIRIVNNIRAMSARVEETAERYGINDLSQDVSQRYGINPNW